MLCNWFSESLCINTWFSFFMRNFRISNEATCLSQNRYTWPNNAFSLEKLFFKSSPTLKEPKASLVQCFRERSSVFGGK